MGQSTPYRVAAYCRVSTSDQNCAAQLEELRRWAASYNWQIVDTFIDTGWSGSKQNRPELKRLMEDARQRKFDCVLVTKLDRFGRSLQHAVATITTLTKTYGIRFMATGQNIDTDQSSPTATLLLHLLAAFAEFERALIVERVTDGLAQARRKGTRIGRPRALRADPIKIRELRASGVSYAKIAAQLGIAPVTVYRVANGIKQIPKPKRRAA